MGEQVTLETALHQQLTARFCTTGLGAQFYLAGLHEGPAAGATHHGAPDLWDWGRTMQSLLAAQDRERQAEQMVRAMTPQQRAMLWLDGHPEREVLRRAARKLVP